MMAEAKAKIVRSNCLRNQINEAHVQNLPLDHVLKAFNKLQTCYDKLEAAQDAFTLVAEEEETVDYLRGTAIRTLSGVKDVMG